MNIEQTEEQIKEKIYLALDGDISDPMPFILPILKQFAATILDDAEQTVTWRAIDIKEMLLDDYGLDEWSTPIQNLKTLILKLEKIATPYYKS